MKKRIKHVAAAIKQTKDVFCVLSAPPANKKVNSRMVSVTGKRKTVVKNVATF